MKSSEEELAESGHTEPIFPPALLRYQRSNLELIGKEVSWYQPVTMPRLLELKKRFPGARLVVGNTEVGIETKFKFFEYPVLINPVHIPELQVISFDETAGLTVGAAVTINALRDYIDELKSTYRNTDRSYTTRGYEAIQAMLTWFASNHIRNVAAIGGNIVTASPISDLNPMLMACGAKLKLSSVDGGSREVGIDSFFLAYRKVDLKPDEVLESVFIPIVQSRLEYVLPFKQARRREDDISIVTSGIRFLLEEAGNGNFVIRNCALSFGGMAPTTIFARRTMELLSGAAWDQDFVTKRAFALLREELNLPDQVPGGQAEYRMTLAVSFLFKAFMIVQKDLLVSSTTSDEEIKEGGVELPPNFLTEEKPSTVGEQKYSMRSKGIQHSRPVPHEPSDAVRNIVGQPRMHKSAESQVCGEAQYTGDKPLPSNALYAFLVMSQRAHARIVSIDASEAEKCPGFVTLLTAKDVTGNNHIGPVVKDEEVFAESVVTHVGAVIAAVIAESHEQAALAARKVKIEYEDLSPVIISIEDAIEHNSFFSDRHAIIDGDLDARKGEAEVHIDGSVRIGGQEHFYLETNNSVVFPVDNGALEVHSSTQNCMKTQNFCASVVGVPAAKVTAHCKRMGGGFGGKETRSVFAACVAALAAHRLQRPVSITLERDVDMAITGQRHAFFVKYAAGATRDGQLKYLDATLYSNGGYSLDLSQAVMDRALFHSDSCYKWPALHVRGFVCRTNQASHTAYRGFGGPQGLFMSETVIQHLAEKLHMRPEDLREKNFYNQQGRIERVHFGEEMTNFYVPRMWEDIHRVADIDRRRREVAAFNKAHSYRKRGMCLLPTKFGINFTAKFMNQGGALVHVYVDGSVYVTHGGTEMGQGLFTKMIQVCAQAFQISEEKVYTAETATNLVPNASPSAASLSTDLYGMAVLDACEQILQRLKPVRDDLREKGRDESWESVISSAYYEHRVNLSAQGFYALANDRCGYDWDMVTSDNSERGMPFNYFTQGIAVTECEIDTLSGDSRVLRTDILMDVGKSINPAIDVGQIEGAFVQGFGWSTMEELIWGDKDHKWVREGNLFTRGPGTYKIPAFNDVPLDFRVHLADTDNPFAVHSSKAIGEPPFFLGAAALFAIKDAINAARSEKAQLEGEDYYPLDLPATSERIRMACVDDITALCCPRGEEHASTFRAKGSW
jgi:xanthine dehydrogenase/oxidase